jgi:hypothetical protein
MDLKRLACFHYLNWNPSKPELRGFAKAMPVGFGVLGLLFLWRHGGMSSAVIALWCAGVVLAVAALIPGLGRLAYLAVYIPASIMGHLVSQVVLTLMFVLVFVPIGLLLRMTGKDLLRLKPSGLGWLRVPSEPGQSSYYNQF